MTTVRTQPSTVYQMPGETKAWVIQYAARIPSGGALATPTATLEDIDTGELYAAGLVGSPTVNGTTVIQVVKDLVVNHTYRLTTSATISGSEVPKAATIIECVAD